MTDQNDSRRRRARPVFSHVSPDISPQQHQKKAFQHMRQNKQDGRNMRHTNRFSAIARIVGALTAAALISLVAAPDAQAADFGGIVITPDANSPVGSLFAVTFQFKKESSDANGVQVTGFEPGDISFSTGAGAGGTVTSITRAATTNIYTVNIRPNSGYSGDLVITLAADAVTWSDTSTNPATSYTNDSAQTRTLSVDQTKPTVALRAQSLTGAEDSDKVVNGKFQVRFHFSEAVTGFTLGDITATNATTSNFQNGSESNTYTADITPTANWSGKVKVSVPGGSVTDSVGNMVEKTELEVTVDQTKPTVTIAAPTEWSAEPLTATITFSEAVTGFDSDDITVKETVDPTANPIVWTDGSASATAVPGGKVWTATINPADTTKQLTIAIAKDVATDNAGIANGPGNGNTAATTKTVTIDAARPTVSGISISDTNHDTKTNALIQSNTVVDMSSDTVTKFYVGINFSEDVTGFQSGQGDVTVSNGTVTLEGALPGDEFTATITPTADYEGEITITVPAGKAQSDADNTKSNPAFSQKVKVSQGRPTPTIAVDKSKTNGTATVTVTFDERVKDFTKSSSPLDGDINVTYNGYGTFKISDYTATGKSKYPAVNGDDYATGFTATLTFPTEGDNTNTATDGRTAVINVVAGVATDIVGNNNVDTTTEAASRTVTFDKTAPTITISSPGSASAAFDTVFTFSEDIKDGAFTASDITVVGGTAGTVTGSKQSWESTITPNAGFSGTLTINIAANVLTDIAGNGNKEYDRVPDVDGNDDTQGIQSWDVIVDQTKPTVVLSSQDKANGAFTATLVFSEPVTGVAAEDFAVPMISNGQDDDATTEDVDESKTAQATVSDISGAATTWTAIITPRAARVAGDRAETPDLDESKAFKGNLAVSFKAGGAIDAAGNGNVVSNTKTIDIDTVKPTLTIATKDSRGTGKDFNGPFTATFTFSEKVTGFSKDDITVGGGDTGVAIGDVSADSSTGTASTGYTTYTAVITPTPDDEDTSGTDESFEGDMTITVAENKAQDLHGNNNVAYDADLTTTDTNETYGVKIDTTEPFAVIAHDYTGDLTEFGHATDRTFTVTFQNGSGQSIEAVTGLKTGDFTYKKMPVSKIVNDKNTADTSDDSEHYEDAIKTDGTVDAAAETTGGASASSVTDISTGETTGVMWRAVINPNSFSPLASGSPITPITIEGRTTVTDSMDVVTPRAKRRLRISLPAGAVTDKAGNSSLAYDSDTNEPGDQPLEILLVPEVPNIDIKPQLTATAFSGNKLSNGQPFQVRFELSHSLSVFDSADVTLAASGRGTSPAPTLTNFSGTGKTYTATITPNLRVVAEDGTVTNEGHTGNLTINVAENINSLGNNASSVTVYVDQDTPQITAFTGPYLKNEDGTLPDIVTSPLRRDRSPFYLKMTVNEQIENLANSDFVIYEVGDTKTTKTSVGTASDFKGSDPTNDGEDQTWEIKITPNLNFNGNMAIEIKTGAGTDKAGTAATLADNLTATLGGTTANPTIVIDQAAPVPLITFTNTSHGNRFVGDNADNPQILHNVIPASDGAFNVIVRFKDGSRTDTNGDPIYEHVSSQYDGEANFTEADIVVSPKGAVTTVGTPQYNAENHRYLVPITLDTTYDRVPDKEDDPSTQGVQLNGPITLSIPKKGAKDLVGHDNIASNMFTVTIDRTAPKLKSITPPTAVAPGQPFDLAFEFNEAVTPTDPNNDNIEDQIELNAILSVAGFNGTLASPTTGTWTVDDGFGTPRNEVNNAGFTIRDGFDIKVTRVANSQTRFNARIIIYNSDFDDANGNDLSNVAVFVNADKAQDLAGANNTASFVVTDQYDPDDETDEPDVVFSSALDKTSPVVTITGESNYDDKANGRYGVEFLFSQLITGLTESDFVVTNGAVVSGSLTQTYTYGTETEPASPKRYFARFTSDGLGDLTIVLPAGAVTDAAKNPSFRAEYTRDLGRPSATIHVVKLEESKWVEDTSPAFNGEIDIEVRFTEDVAFERLQPNDDLPIAVSGGIERAGTTYNDQTTADNIRDWLDKDGAAVTLDDSSADYGRIYRTKIVPSEFVGGKADFALTIGLAANAIEDRTGNGNRFVQKTVQIDQTKPTVVITPTEIGNNVANGNVFTVTFTYDELVHGFVASDSPPQGVTADINSSGITGGALVANSLTRSLKNGTVVTDAAKPAEIHTIQIDPDDGVTAVTFPLAAGAVTDEAGNQSAVYDSDSEATGNQPHRISVDTVRPIPRITGPKGDKYGAGPFLVSIEFSDDWSADPEVAEAVTGFMLSDLTITGGIASNFVDISDDTTAKPKGSKYQAQIAPTSPTTGSTVTVALAENAAKDSAGNFTKAYDSDTTKDGNQPYTATFDANLPYIRSIEAKTLDKTKTIIASKANFLAIVNFSEAVDSSSFTAGDMTIEGGTVKDNLISTISSSSYSMVIVPDPEVKDDPLTNDVNEKKDAFEGDLAISVNAGAATATALPANRTTVASATKFVRIDRTAPKVTAFTLNNGAALAHNQFTFSVAITFDEDMDTASWVKEDLTVTGGTVVPGSVGNTGLRTLTANINSPQQQARVSLGPNKVTDIVGNGNAAHDGASIAVASNDPTVSLFVVDGDYGPRNTTPFQIQIVFNQSVGTSFVVGDLTVTGGTADQFTRVSGQIYTARITPNANASSVAVSVAAGVAQNTGGRNNKAGSMRAVSISTSNNTVNITSTSTSVTVGTAFNVNVSFSQSTSSFPSSAITVVNGYVSKAPQHVSQNKNWVVGITPTGGDVSVYLVQNVVNIGGSGNAPSNVFSIKSSSTPPTPAGLIVKITGPAAVKSGASTLSIQFSRGVDSAGKPVFVTVSGFELTDMEVLKGDATLSALTPDTDIAGLYTMTLTPDEGFQGDVEVNIKAGAAVDDLGNPSARPSKPFKTKVDSTPPTVAISGPDGPANGAVELTITFSELVTGFDADDLTVSGATAGDIAGTDDSKITIDGVDYYIVYKTTLTPAEDYNGQLTADIAADAAMDTAGNMSTAAEQYAVTIDQTPPTVTVTGPTPGPIDDTEKTITIAFSEEVTGFELADIDAMLDGGSANVSVSTLVEDADTKGLYTATIQASEAGALTVDVAADKATDLAGNMNTAAETYSVQVVLDTTFTVQLTRGLNMIHIPVKVENPDDPEAPYKVSHLYDELGGLAGGVLYVLSLNDAGNFVAYTGSPGSSGDTILSEHTAVIVNMLNAKSVEFTGGLLDEEVSLKGGINLMGVPRYLEGRKATEVASDVQGAIVLVLAKNKFGNDEFRLPNDDDVAYGGRGYIVFAPGNRADVTKVTYSGEAWSDDNKSEDAAPSTAASADALKFDPTATPVLLVEGSFAREDTLEPINGLSVSIKNLRTGESVVDTAGLTAGSGRFVKPMIDLRGGSYEAGDALEVSVVDPSGTFGGLTPVRAVVSKDEIADGRIDIGRHLLSAVPDLTALLPNYPNPFNPETWIPFDLAKSSQVKVTVYNAAGQTVRVLELGQLPAGQYRSRSKAAYWDGRNALGERVSSGLYFYRIEAGSFSALRRMVILK